MNNKTIIFSGFFIIGIILIVIGFQGLQNLNNPPIEPGVVDEEIVNNEEEFNLSFNGSNAWNYLKAQVDIGFRFPGSPEIEMTRVLIAQVLKMYNWQIIYHNFSYQGIESANIVAFPENSSRHNVTLFGAHYDTRWEASRDVVLENKNKPVLGANDGASGVAVLLEFSRIFASREDVGLLFIDAEDQGGIKNWSYIAGSTEFVKESTLSEIFPNGKSDIEAFVLLDMIGDYQLNIKKERHSTREIINEIWSKAATLNYSNAFVNQEGYYMTDDHIPFLNAGIPAVDLIDFNYDDENGNNLHHTINDTLDYVSENSLWIVGQTLEFWMSEKT